MNHRATQRFWRHYQALEPAVRAQADKAFALLRNDSRHPSVHLKKVGTLWSARVTRDYRALAIEDSEGLVWIWIGSHAEYRAADRLGGTRQMSDIGGIFSTLDLLLMAVLVGSPGAVVGGLVGGFVSPARRLTGIFTGAAVGFAVCLALVIAWVVWVK